MFKVRKFTPRKRIAARNPITQFKRKHSVAKYTNPIKTTKKRWYNWFYSRTTVDSINALQGIEDILKKHK